MLKLLSVLLYCLRWLAWAFHYLIICPAGTVALIFILIFWLDNSTPGQVAADEIAASTRYVSHGEFRIPGHCGPNPGGPLYGERCRSTDAAGYASFVKKSVDELWRGNLKVLWVVMAVVFSGAALLMECRPYFCLYGQMRSARFRYGIPASRPASATETVKTADNKKEDNRE